MTDVINLLTDEEDIAQEYVNVYDDVADENSINGVKSVLGVRTNSVCIEPVQNPTSQPITPSIPVKRFQLFVGNLTWWTSDQDITDAVNDIGVNDFSDVKFFEDRITGQSKGFCVISLASEAIMRMCMEKLPQKKLNGQCPVVTYPTAEALTQFEAQSKTRVASPPQSNSNKPQQSLLPLQINNAPRFMTAPRQQLQQPPRGGVPAPGTYGPRMLGFSHQIMYGYPQNAMLNYQPVPGFVMVPRPYMMIQTMQTQSRPPTPGRFQGPPSVQGMSRPPHHGGAPQTMLNNSRVIRPEWNPPAGPSVYGMTPSAQGPSQQSPSTPHIHVNPAFFQQSQHQNWQQVGREYGSQSSSRPRGGADERRKSQDHPIQQQEFEEIMSRNRTVSSSAITRAVAEAAAGDYASAIKILVTAISLIRESKVADDERCQILINSLQVTLDGIEAKSYGHRRDRSRSRDRERWHKHCRREQSRSREYRERSRENGRDRDRQKESRFYDDRDRERGREGCRIVREPTRDRFEHRRESSHRTARR